MEIVKLQQKISIKDIIPKHILQDFSIFTTPIKDSSHFSEQQVCTGPISICACVRHVKSGVLINSAGFKLITINKHFITCIRSLPKHPSPLCRNCLFLHAKPKLTNGEKKKTYRLAAKITTTKAECISSAIKRLKAGLLISGKDKSLLMQRVVPLM